MKLETESEYFAIISETQILPASFSENSLNVRLEKKKVRANFTIRRVKLTHSAQAQSSIPKLSLVIESNMDSFYEKDSEGDWKEVKTLTMDNGRVVPEDERIPTHQCKYEFTKEDYKDAIDCGILSNESEYKDELFKRLSFNDVSYENQVEIDQCIEDFDHYSVVFQKRTDTIFQVREIIPPIFPVELDSESAKKISGLINDVHKEIKKIRSNEQVATTEAVQEKEANHLRNVQLNTELDFDKEDVETEIDQTPLQKQPKKVQIQKPIYFEEEISPTPVKKKPIEPQKPVQRYYEEDVYDDELEF